MSYHQNPSVRAHTATLLEHAVLQTANRIDTGQGFTVRDLMAELEHAVRWVLNEHLHHEPNAAGGRARLRYFAHQPEETG